LRIWCDDEIKILKKEIKGANFRVNSSETTCCTFGQIWFKMTFLADNNLVQNSARGYKKAINLV